jgi:hypothetical protein
LDRNMKQTVKHGGGNVMVWGCITPNGTGRLHQVEGCMNAIQYCNILSESLLGTLTNYSTTTLSILYQQDNNLKHTSWRAQMWFKDHNIELASHPAQSPNMNPSEHAWDMVDRKLHACCPQPSNVDQLWAALKEWENLDVGYIHTFYESMPCCVQTLLDAKGGHTKY